MKTLAIFFVLTFFSSLSIYSQSNPLAKKDSITISMLECSQKIDSMFSKKVMELESKQEKNLDKIASHYSIWLDEADWVVGILGLYLALIGVVFPFIAYINFNKIKNEYNDLIKTANESLSRIDSKFYILEKNLNEKIGEIEENKIKIENKIESHNEIIANKLEERFRRLDEVENELKESINRKVQKEIDWIQNEKDTIKNQFDRLWSMEDKLDGEVRDVVKEYKNEIDRLKSDYKLIIEGLDSNANRIKDSRVAFNNLYIDIIHFCMNIMHTAETSSIIPEQTKKTYHNKFEEHSLAIGLYSESLSVIYSSLQQLLEKNEYSADLLIHLDHLENHVNIYEVDETNDEFTMKNDVLKLIDLVICKYKLWDAGHLK